MGTTTTKESEARTMTTTETFTVERYNVDAGQWETFKTGEGPATFAAIAGLYLPLGWGGHTRSEASLAAIAAGFTVSTPLGYYRLGGTWGQWVRPELDSFTDEEIDEMAENASEIISEALSGFRHPDEVSVQRARQVEAEWRRRVVARPSVPSVPTSPTVDDGAPF
jgi:hypothetical protein